MQPYVIHLHLKPMLAAWVRYHYGCPARFPSRSMLNLAITLNLSRPPRHAAPQLPEPGTFPVCVPDSRLHPPSSYNHLSSRAEHRVIREITQLFTLHLSGQLRSYRLDGLSYFEAAVAYCRSNGIPTCHADTIRQRDYQDRRRHLPCRVDVSSHRVQ